MIALALLAASASFAAPAPAKKPDFPALVAAVKAAPADDAAREALLKAAGRQKSLPPMPVEGRRHFVKAATLQQDAKTPAETAAAVEEYRLALAEAPWRAEVYFNMALAQETAGDFAGARKSLGFYLLTSPKDAEAAQDKLFALEAKAEKAAGEAAKRAWLEGAWSVQITWIANGRAQQPFPSFEAVGEPAGNGMLIRRASGGLDILRAVPEGDGWRWSFWQEPLPSRPANCAVPTGWQDVSVDVSSDKRTLTLRVPTYWTHACEMGGIDANVYRLTR